MGDLTGSTRLSPEAVQKAMAEHGHTVHQLMIALVPEAARYARTPLSHFNVGAVVLGQSGALYLGSNMEFPGQALSTAVHGEQSAINHAWLSGETGLQAVAVNAAPCGYCRQYMTEVAHQPDALDILLKSAPGDAEDLEFSIAPLSEFLPNAFGPGDLGIDDRVMGAGQQKIAVNSDDALVLAALEAAQRSYSPYTANFAGVAIKLSDGAVFQGRYSENAAYSPSMSPLQSALALMNMRRGVQEPIEIARAVLAEAKSAPISQKDATTGVLSSVASGVTLEHYLF